MKTLLLIISLLVASAPVAVFSNEAVDMLIKIYQPETAIKPDATKGSQLWRQEFSGKAPYIKRSCKTCHTANLKQQGKHVRTNKIIKAMAPSVNSESLTDSKKIKKWLKRNCKWTLGRECSNDEKIHLLRFLSQK